MTLLLLACSSPSTMRPNDTASVQTADTGSAPTATSEPSGGEYGGSGTNTGRPGLSLMLRGWSSQGEESANVWISTGWRDEPPPLFTGTWTPPPEHCEVIANPGGGVYPPERFVTDRPRELPSHSDSLALTLDGLPMAVTENPVALDWVPGAVLGASATDNGFVASFDYPELFVLAPPYRAAATVLPDGSIEVTWTPAGDPARPQIGISASMASTVTCFVDDDGNFVIPAADAAAPRTLGRLAVAAEGGPAFQFVDDQFIFEGSSIVQEIVEVR